MSDIKTKSEAYLSVYFCAIAWNYCNMEKLKRNRELMALTMDLVIPVIDLHIKIDRCASQRSAGFDNNPSQEQ